MPPRRPPLAAPPLAGPPLAAPPLAALPLASTPPAADVSLPASAMMAEDDERTTMTGRRGADGKAAGVGEATVLTTLWFGFTYIAASTVQSFFNKQVFSAGFNFPIALCFTQMMGIIAFLFSWHSLRQWWASRRMSTPRRPLVGLLFSLDQWRDKIRVLAPIALCFSLNLGLANASLYVVDMNIFIVVRSTSIVWIAVFSRLILGERISARRLIACTIVFAGSLTVGWSFARHAPPREGVSSFAKMLGLAALVASTIANGVMCVLMKKVLTQIKQQMDKKTHDAAAAAPPHFEKYDFLLFQSVDAAIFLLVGMLGGGEMSQLLPVLTGQAEEGASTAFVLGVLALSSFVTVGYQMSLIGLISSTTPLGKEIISQTKVVPQVIAGIIIFNEYVSALSITGLIMTVTGVFMYSMVARAEGQAAAAAAARPLVRARQAD